MQFFIFSVVNFSQIKWKKTSKIFSKKLLQEVLKNREAHIKSVFETAQAQLANLSQDQSSYRDMLEKLLIQASFQLLEPNALIICRENDQQIIEVIYLRQQDKN